ncbi:hypothetical protein PUN4_780070 [Paraburkholderia unamae]|nr:hypothetical protein PUN4_780070 [Paraburkholderia unamae]
MRGEGEKGPDRSPGKATGHPAAEVSVRAPRALHAGRENSNGPALSQSGERARGAARARCACRRARVSAHDA